ncbi:MAG: pilus assembly protein PilM [Phycisphaerales bacterium]|nr:MAG: pilus assembly protein PilM [Phycisphaerales bacterium]
MVSLGSGHKVVSFDWDWRSLRIGEAGVSGSKVRVRRLVCGSMEPGLAYGDPEGLGRHIRRVLDEEGISTKRAIVDIPRDQAVLHTLTLPAASDEELAGLVRFQIVRELPFPLDDAVVDFAAEPRGEDGQQRVLVAAVRNDVLEFFRRVFVHAGLKLERIGLRPYANLVALAQAVPEANQGRTLFVDVGPTLTEIDIVVDGRLVFSRAASVNVSPRPGENEVPERVADAVSDEDADSVGSLLMEVRRTLEAYRATAPDSRMDRIVVGGSCGVESDLSRALHRNLGAPANEYHPQDTSLEAMGDEVPVAAFAATLGLMLSQADRTGRRFDFLHPKEPEAVKRERKKRIPMIAATIVLAAIAGGVFFWRAEVAPRRTQLADLDREVKRLKPISKELEKFHNLVEQVIAFDESEAIWIDEMRRLVEALPESQHAYVTQLVMKEPGWLRFKLAADNNQRANEIATKLLAMRDEDGKQRYEIKVGSTRKSKDPKYPFNTELNVEFYREETSKNKRRR